MYLRADDEFDLRVRMFAPLDGVPEDPATGSSNCALAAMLGYYKAESEGDFERRIAHGVETQRNNYQRLDWGLVEDGGRRLYQRLEPIR